MGVILTAVAAGACSAESAPNVIKKVKDVYTKAKSYQGTVTTLQSGKMAGGKSASITQTVRVQFQAPNMFHVSVTLAGAGTGAGQPTAQQLAQQQRELFCDGKTLYQYAPSQKMYVKQPAPPSVQIAGLVRALQFIPPPESPGLTILPTSSTVHGHPAYVLEVKPVAKAGMKPEDKKKFDEAIKKIQQNPRFMIDKQNYSLLAYSVSSGGQRLEIDMSSQVFGAPIPARSFAFAPPPGAKEFHPPAAAPGAPGASPVPGGAPLPGGR